MDQFETTSLIADADLKPLADLLRPVLTGLGFDLVRLTRPDVETLQLMAEREGGGEIIVADCAAISRAVGTILDEHDPIAVAYSLEVSSPGIDRPLTRVRDFTAWAGFLVRCVTTVPARIIEGRIDGIDAAGLRLRGEGEVMTIPLSQLTEVKLILNDELLQATRKVAPAA